MYAEARELRKPATNERFRNFLVPHRKLGRISTSLNTAIRLLSYAEPEQTENRQQKAHTQKPLRETIRILHGSGRQTRPVSKMEGTCHKAPWSHSHACRLGSAFQNP
jgi:hypothetical protein